MRTSTLVLTCCVLMLAGCAGGEGEENPPIFTTSAGADTNNDESQDTETGDGTMTTGDGDTGDGDTGDGDTTTTTTTGEETTTTEEGGAVCGNGIKEPGEECDGNDLAGLTCLDYGHDNGTLICADDCTIFSDACSTCGDGQLAATEACDGNNFGGLTCVDLGYVGGTLSCAADCSQVFENGCDESPSCGNGLIDAGEDCDGNNLNGQTCQTQGFDGGTLTCNNCVFNVGGCTVDQCVGLLGACNFLFDDCCDGLVCAVSFCAPE